ncbi:hypothetical protein RN001_011330 [Aquatica leii]|uniref:FUN14 domain-containing protein 1 n=1 Tax=Aquatica leii TaxID=1421715 RepID=A0AAN7PVV9_9COLE|nr:hypothetical protein RN001_011330 [Aquatica leii]
MIGTNHKKLKVLFGAISGWITSMLVLKIGKVLAFVVGSAIVYMEFSKDEEFLKIDWNKINERFVATPDNFKELNNIWVSTEDDSFASNSLCKVNDSKFSSFLLAFIGGVLMAVGSH